MFIRPWVRVLHARMNRPDGWVYDTYRWELREPLYEGSSSERVVIGFWVANGIFSFAIDTWNSDRVKNLRMNPVEFFYIYVAAQRLKHHGKHPKRRARKEALASMHASIITKLTGLED